MHLIQDENGSMVGHAHEHTHDHCHEHSHDHSHECSHECGSCGEADHAKETLALLTYMLSHNEQHANELDQMANNLEKLGMADAAKQIKEGVSDFQKGNMRLSLALTLVKEQQKEA